MKNLTHKEFNQLRHNAKVLAADEFGDKVLLLTDQSIIKLFRVKRLISSATIYSPAKRFAVNVEKLQRLSIPTVTIRQLYNIKSIQRTAVHYEQLIGETVREYILSGKADDAFFIKLGQFLAHLHEQGIYFRSVHFGNIIYTPEQQLGLIDVSDMKIYKSPLNKNKRLRNLKHFFRLPEDINLVKAHELIEHSYLDKCSLRKKAFMHQFLHTCETLKNINESN